MEPSNDTQLQTRHQSLEQAPTQNNPTRSSRQRPPVKLRCIYDSSKDNENPGTKTKPIDFFAIHGLDTESPKTWTWKKNPNDSKDKGVNWLVHRDMLPKSAGPCRVFTCDWPAKLFETVESEEDTFEELAILLLEAILDHLIEQRPIFFIASCLGGIILMKALSMANDQYHPQYHFIKSNTGAIIFLSTPFRGTAFHTIAKWAEPGLKVWAKSQGCRVTRRLDFAKESNSELTKLVGQFTQVLKTENYELSTFYEKKPTDLRRKIPFVSCLLPSKPMILVNQSSATLDWDNAPIPLDRNHARMNKFPHHEDGDYELVAGRIVRAVKNIREGTPLQQADTCILRHYAEERLKIERLSGDALEMNQCYINLAIVEQWKDKTEAASAQGSPFALENRLNITASREDLLVDLPTLFSPHENSPGYTKDPRRILIRGRAGIGKTTLCKKIVHNFIHENMWGNLFARILWVPLRELKAQPPGYNLGDMFRHVYFRDQPDGQKLTEALWDTVKKTDYSDSLFILDGLDEVSELLTSAKPEFGFFKELLNRPNVIITTRPYTQLPSNVKKCHRELETIGFDQDQVHNYISKVQNPHNAHEIRAFLQNHRLVQSLVRIPILLDALCFTWDENLKNTTVLETMTAIYDAIVQRLWKGKDILRLDKSLKGPVRKAFDSEIEEITKTESEILERLAFSGMYSNVIEFQPEHQDRIYTLLKPDTQGRVFHELLGSLSFLRSSDSFGSTNERSYHFLHLTFQEFYAAKYFVRQWQSRQELEFVDFKAGKVSTAKTNAFLGQEKYTGRYDILWRFTVGLLQLGEVKDNGVQDGEERDNGVRNFLETIEREPIDLIGPTHQRLIVYCLSEANTWKSKLRSDLESRLSQWLLWECDLHIEHLILGEPEFPDAVLLSALKNSTKLQEFIIMNYFSWKDISFSELVVAALIAGIEEENYVGLPVAFLLARSSNLSEATNDRLVRLIVNEQTEEDVRSAAFGCLAAQSKYSEAAITALVDIEKRRSQGQSTLAEAEALGNQLNSSESVIARLFGEKYTESYTELIATSGLARHRSLSETVATAFIWLIENLSGGLQLRLIAMAGGVQLPENVITALISLMGSDRMRDEVARVLWHQKELSQDTMVALSKLVENKSSDFSTRLAAAQVIARRGTFPERLAREWLELIENKDESEADLLIATNALKYHRLSESTTGALATLIENKSSSENLQCWACDILSNQRNLSETTITSLVKLLENETSNEEARCDALYALYRQKYLSRDIITMLICLVENVHESKKVRVTAVEALGGQHRLPEEAIERLIRLVENERESEEIREAVVTRCLTEANIHDLIAFHKSEDPRWRTAQRLGRKSNLSDQLVNAMKSALESGRISEGLDFLKCLYESFLHRGSMERFCMYIEDGDLVIYLPSGSRIKIKGVPPGEVLAAIDEGRRLIKSSSQDYDW
ncbi:armadillo-type protein [Nemania sp. FL0031]|nr:armadillo-type protein [Nemania sp. FL0031]